LAQLIKFTLRRGPTVQTEMSLTTAGIHCAISHCLSGAIEDCSTVRVQAAENALSPKVLYVRVTTHVRLIVEHSRRSRASATRRQSLARYGGETPDNQHWRLWSERRVPVTRRAAAFWTDCSRFISPSEMPKNSVALTPIMMTIKSTTMTFTSHCDQQQSI